MRNGPYFTPHPGTAGQEVITSRHGLLLKIKLVQSAGMKRGPSCTPAVCFSLFFFFFFIPCVALNSERPHHGAG